MSAITIDLPEDTWLALGADRERAASELRLAAGVKLFELGRLSSGAAAHLAGIPRVEFLARAAEFGVDVLDIGEGELDADLRRA